MNATRSAVSGRTVSAWWLAFFAALAIIDAALVGIDIVLAHRFPTWLQAGVFVQGLSAVIGLGLLTFALREAGYAVIAILFALAVVEDWWQMLEPARLWFRQVVHAALPVLGEPRDRLTAPDPADVIAAGLAACVVLVAVWIARQENRRNMWRLTLFLAIGFAFGGVVDLYNDLNYSRKGIFFEEFGEAIAVSGMLSYAVGVILGVRSHGGGTMPASRRTSLE